MDERRLLAESDLAALRRAQPLGVPHPDTGQLAYGVIRRREWLLSRVRAFELAEQLRDLDAYVQGGEGGDSPLERYMVIVPLSETEQHAAVLSQQGDQEPNGIWLAVLHNEANDQGEVILSPYTAVHDAARWIRGVLDRLRLS